MLSRKLIITSDGSSSIFIPEWNEQYHSQHGAVQEAYHVFIRSGFERFQRNNLDILEVGLGTGLNCFITFLESKIKGISVTYTGVEAFPVSEEEYRSLNYIHRLDATAHAAVFNRIHTSPWNEKVFLSKTFCLIKQRKKFQEIDDTSRYDLIYFDAFSPRVQPELWTEVQFDKMYKALREKGVLVTYSAKGSVRRAMQAVGFQVVKIPGPPGKREMLRAVK